MKLRVLQVLTRCRTRARLFKLFLSHERRLCWHLLGISSVSGHLECVWSVSGVFPKRPYRFCFFSFLPLQVLSTLQGFDFRPFPPGFVVILMKWFWSLVLLSPVRRPAVPCLRCYAAGRPLFKPSRGCQYSSCADERKKIILWLRK